VVNSAFICFLKGLFTLNPVTGWYIHKFQIVLRNFPVDSFGAMCTSHMRSAGCSFPSGILRRVLSMYCVIISSTKNRTILPSLLQCFLAQLTRLASKMVRMASVRSVHGSRVHNPGQILMRVQGHVTDAMG
jgi:hypothetical protein